MKERAKKIVEKAQSGLSRGLGVSFLVDAGHFIGDSVRNLFNISRIEQRETFEQAQRRMNLSEADIAKKITQYWKQLGFFFCASLLVFVYAVYLFYHNAWGSGLVSIIAALVLSVYGLRAHFWIFQMKNKKLGCTLKEWWDNKIIKDDDVPHQNKSLKK